MLSYFMRNMCVCMRCLTIKPYQSKNTTKTNKIDMWKGFFFHVNFSLRLLYFCKIHKNIKQNKKNLKNLVHIWITNAFSEWAKTEKYQEKETTIFYETDMSFYVETMYSFVFPFSIFHLPFAIRQFYIRQERPLLCVRKRRRRISKTKKTSEKNEIEMHIKHTVFLAPGKFSLICCTYIFCPFQR